MILYWNMQKNSHPFCNRTCFRMFSQTEVISPAQLCKILSDGNLFDTYLIGSRALLALLRSSCNVPFDEKAWINADIDLYVRYFDESKFKNCLNDLRTKLKLYHPNKNFIVCTADDGYDYSNTLQARKILIIDAHNATVVQTIDIIHQNLRFKTNNDNLPIQDIISMFDLDICQVACSFEYIRPTLHDIHHSCCAFVANVGGVFPKTVIQMILDYALKDNCKICRVNHIKFYFGTHWNELAAFHLQNARVVHPTPTKFKERMLKYQARGFSFEPIEVEEEQPSKKLKVPYDTVLII